MSVDDWLQNGKWASGDFPDVGGAAGRALEGLGGLFDRSKRKAGKAKDKAKERLHDTAEKYELDDRLGAARDRVGAMRESAKGKAAVATERALRFVKDRSPASIARAGVQVKAGLAGFGMGYLFPDVEVLFLGIGGRGRWLVQSGIPVWGAEKLAHYLLVEAAPPEDSNRMAKWDVRKELYGTVAAPLLTGFSAGLGLRLVQEATNFHGSDAFRIIVGGRAMIVERVWMLGNGIWCFAMGRDLLMVTLGRQRGQSVSEMLRRLREGQEEEDEGEEAGE